MAELEVYQAIVEKVICKGRHGPYAVARHDTIGLITFSLDREVWSEVTYPEPGTYVLLSEVTRKRAGWRASNGRYFRPADAQHSVSEQSKKGRKS